jgi:hypothetical protein
MLPVYSELTGASLVRDGRREISAPIHERYEKKSNSLHMSWVLVDDTKGNHRIQMRWVVDR